MRLNKLVLIVCLNSRGIGYVKFIVIALINVAWGEAKMSKHNSSPSHGKG